MEAAQRPHQPGYVESYIHPGLSGEWSRRIVGGDTPPATGALAARDTCPGWQLMAEDGMFP